ncbi:hypothetical protein [Botryobacter ruber]|uniref:hypothetical protein n=1 Tax=Botryobacter ruber TaxID=2171629 RepID=UPI000E0B8EC0|nr:hypothetical protein [Botryobacter ruber]
MFAITHNIKESSLSYDYMGRLIHFGANFKSIEHEWEEWKTKFENLLTQLYWLEADVHFKTEYAGIQPFSWSLDLLKWTAVDNKELNPIQKYHWTHEGEIDWAK